MLFNTPSARSAIGRLILTAFLLIIATGDLLAQRYEFHRVPAPSLDHLTVTLSATNTSIELDLTTATPHLTEAARRGEMVYFTIREVRTARKSPDSWQIDLSGADDAHIALISRPKAPGLVCSPTKPHHIGDLNLTRKRSTPLRFAIRGTIIDSIAQSDAKAVLSFIPNQGDSQHKPAHTPVTLAGIGLEVERTTPKRPQRSKNTAQLPNPEAEQE